MVHKFYGIGTSCGFSAGGAAYNISDYYYLAPGEEGYFGWVAGFGTACDRRLVFVSGATGAYTVGGASSVCQNSSSAPGTVQLPSLGFEYIQYVDGQQITKRQMGKQVNNPCLKAWAC